MSSLTVLENRVLQRMREVGWSEQTPIQRKALPVILRRRSALLVAPTGSGKTEAAVIPIFASLSSVEHLKKGVRMLYITPLRALNRDIFRRIISYAEREGLTVDVRHGDTPSSARQRMVEKPPDVLITTPETLAIILTSRRMRQNLRSLKWIVVDELHELLGSERGSHLAVSLERAEDLSAGGVVRIGLSATVGDLDEAGRFLAGSSRRHAVLVDSSIRRYDVSCSYVDGSHLDAARHILNYVEERGLKGRSVLVFTNTRDEAEYLGAVLKAKAPDMVIEVHHGSLSREMREEAEAKLRGGEAGIVVATSSLELGLDIGAVDLVVLWGSPRQAVKLVQRVGRSRHRVGESAAGLILTNRLDDELEGLALIERVRRSWLEASSMHVEALDVMAHHLVGLALEKGELSLQEAVEVLRRAYPFRDIDVEDIDSCLRFLDRHGVVRYDGVLARRRGPKTYEYYYENISTIPDVLQFDVFDISSKKLIGRLDQMFVGEYVEPGRPFLLKGSSWRTVSMDDGRRIVHVEPLMQDISTVPYWIGELIPVDYYTAQEVGKLRRRIGSESGFEVSSRQRERLHKTGDMLSVIPDDKTLVVEKKAGANILVLHECFGSKVNQALATVLSTLISSKTGFLVEARSDPYRILLSSNGVLNVDYVAEVLKEDLNLEEILKAAVIGTHPLNWKTWHVAKRFGLISRDAQYDRRTARLIQDRYVNTPLYKEVLRELFLEKYDLEKTRIILSSIRKGVIKVVVREVEDFTPLAKPILEYASSFTALPLTIEKTVLALVRERLQNTRHKLVCLSCGRWDRIVKTKEAQESIVCTICKSRLVTSTFISDEDISRILAKKAKGKPLSQDDMAKMKKYWKTASLIQNFGRRALYVLSGYGVGVDTAARILRKYVEDEEELLKNIYRAEKLYVATRGFWRE